MMLSGRSEPAKKMPPPVPSQRVNEEERFRKAFKVSFILHCALFVSAVLSYVVFPGKPVVYTPSVRVDLVGLPDLKKTDLTKANTAESERLQKILKEPDPPKPKEKEAAPPPKETKKKPADPDPADMALKDKNKKKEPEKDRKKALSAAIERMKALQKLEESVKKEEAAQAPAKGNILSRGSQMFGDSTGEVNEYVDVIVARVRHNWHLPLWLAKQKLSAKVILYILPSGRIDRVVFTQSSGNEQFDRYVERAIQASAPFDAPPSDIESDGISLGFPL